MKTLIAYYSFTQNNEKLAKHLHKQLNCDIVKIETTKKRNGLSILFDIMFKRKPEIKPVPYYLQDYDHVIFIAPIWAGRIAMPMKSFLIEEKSNIKQYSFITLCGGSTGQREKIQRELVSIVDIPPDKVVELWVNKLLSVKQKDTIKHTLGYRIQTNEFSKFEAELKQILDIEKLVPGIKMS